MTTSISKQLLLAIYLQQHQIAKLIQRSASTSNNILVLLLAKQSSCRRDKLHIRPACKSTQGRATPHLTFDNDKAHHVTITLTHSATNYSDLHKRGGRNRVANLVEGEAVGEGDYEQQGMADGWSSTVGDGQRVEQEV
jgi:hypothetical protein